MKSSPSTPSSSAPPAGRTLFPWVALLAVAGAFSVFAAAQALWPSSGPRVAEGPAENKAAPTVPPAPARCGSCGVVEAIEPAPAVDGRPAGWIFSVRMPDGSLRHSSDPLRGRWRVGDGMQLIGGERSWGVP